MEVCQAVLLAEVITPVSSTGAPYGAAHRSATGEGGQGEGLAVAACRRGSRQATAPRTPRCISRPIHLLSPFETLLPSVTTLAYTAGNFLISAGCSLLTGDLVDSMLCIVLLSRARSVAHNTSSACAFIHSKLALIKLSKYVKG